MKTTARITLVAFLLAPTFAAAEGLNLSARGSTLGLGLEVGYAFNEHFNIRLASNNYSYDYETTEDEIQYNFDLELKSTALLLDYHPFAGSFRLTGGILDNKNKLDGTAVPTGSYDIGGTTYTGSDVGTLYSNVVLGDKNPLYFGLGWSKALGDSGFGLGFDLGLVMQGSPDVSLSADGPIASDPQFQADMRAEEEQLQQDMDQFETYPVIAIGITYQF